MEGLLTSLQTFSRIGYQVDARLYAYAMGLQQNANRRAEGRGSRNLEGRGGGFLDTIVLSCAVSFLVGLTAGTSGGNEDVECVAQEHPWSTLLAFTIVNRHVHHL